MSALVPTFDGRKFVACDDRRNQPLARAAHAWAADNGCEIHCGFWGSGRLISASGGDLVNANNAPAFVKEHIGWRSPDESDPAVRGRYEAALEEAAAFLAARPA
jgi:hypothetical protein